MCVYACVAVVYTKQQLFVWCLFTLLYSWVEHQTFTCERLTDGHCVFLFDGVSVTKEVVYVFLMWTLEKKIVFVILDMNETFFVWLRQKLPFESTDHSCWEASSVLSACIDLIFTCASMKQISIVGWPEDWGWRVSKRLEMWGSLVS